MAETWRRCCMEPKARDLIGAGLLAGFLMGFVALLLFLTWQAAA